MTIFYKIFTISLVTFLLTAGYQMPTQAFSIIPTTSAASKSFVPSESYKLSNGMAGVVTRQPIAFTSISRGGTESFLSELKAEFPESGGWKFLAATDDLKGSFNVSAYYVFVNGTVVSGCGAGFAFDYIPRETDPTTGNNTELHWIQRIVSNHRRGSDHGVPENRIAVWGANSKKKPSMIVPFFDIAPKNDKQPLFSSRATPPHFEYDVGKNDPENNHQWSSEVYLASINKKDPKTVTIYNGVTWGWENKISSESPQTVR